MDQKTKIILAYELDTETEMPRRHIATELRIGKSTLYRWLKRIKLAGGVHQFLEEYELAKKGEREQRKIDSHVKRCIWELREKHNHCCGQKLKHYLEREKGVCVGKTTIYRILKEKYQLRSKWKKNQKRGHTPSAKNAREVVQMDSVVFGDIFAFTGIDIYTREVDVLMAPRLTARYGYTFLKQSMKRRFGSHVDTVQTDGGPEFKQQFKENVLKYADRHRVARPYRKNEQSYIESFNRSLRKECLGWRNYKSSELDKATDFVEDYLDYYHNQRIHCSLDYLTPNQFKVSHI